MISDYRKFPNHENAFDFPNLQFLSFDNHLGSGPLIFKSEFENLKHLIVKDIQINKENGLKNLEILELLSVHYQTPVGNIALWLPKLKELHIKKVVHYTQVRTIFEEIRLVKKTKKDLKCFYADVEFCDELANEPHYFSQKDFTEYQLYFLQKYRSKLSSRPFYLPRLNYLGDLCGGYQESSFISNKLPFVVEVEVSQQNWLLDDSTFSSQEKMLGFLRNFHYLQSLFLAVYSVDQQFYDSLPDLHPYLQRLYFGILLKKGTYEIQMKLPDLNFLTRFKYLFDFDSHHISPPEDMENLTPTLDEHQKFIIQRIKRKGSEFEQKVKSKPFLLARPEVLSSSKKFFDELYDYSSSRDTIYLPIDIWCSVQNSEPAARFYQNIGIYLQLF